MTRKAVRTQRNRDNFERFTGKQRGLTSDADRCPASFRPTSRRGVTDRCPGCPA